MITPPKLILFSVPHLYPIRDSGCLKFSIAMSSDISQGSILRVIENALSMGSAFKQQVMFEQYPKLLQVIMLSLCNQLNEQSEVNNNIFWNILICYCFMIWNNLRNFYQFYILIARSYHIHIHSFRLLSFSTMCMHRNINIPDRLSSFESLSMLHSFDKYWDICRYSNNFKAKYPESEFAGSKSFSSFHVVNEKSNWVKNA